MGLRHRHPHHAASQRSHPAQTKSHFPTNSLSEAGGQVINHQEQELGGEGEGQLGAQMEEGQGELGEGWGCKQKRRNGDRRQRGKGAWLREGGVGKSREQRREREGGTH